MSKTWLGYENHSIEMISVPSVAQNAKKWYKLVIWNKHKINVITLEISIYFDYVNFGYFFCRFYIVNKTGTNLDLRLIQTFFKIFRLELFNNLFKVKFHCTHEKEFNF